MLSGGEGGSVDDRSDPVSPPPPSPSVQGQFSHAAVAVDSEPCSAVGRDILSRDGTAVDAAVAVLFCNGVVVPQSMGVGGGFIMTVHLADGTAESLVAREMAPAAATMNMFSNKSSTVGPFSSGVPGEVKGYWEAKQKYGNPRISWAELLQPSIDLCFDGIRVTAHAANALRRSKKRILQDPGLRALFVDDDTDDVLKEGDVYTNTVFGETLKKIAAGGADVFYNGEVGRDLIRDMREAGGIMTMDDLSNYRVSWETPVSAVLPGTDLTLLTSPPPASGSVMMSILGIAGSFQPRPSDINRPVTWHRWVEACKWSYARRTLLGDWSDENIRDSVIKTVTNMTNDEWWSQVRDSVSDDSTSQDPEEYGAEFSDTEDSGTAHVSILAPNGDAVSVTSTVNLFYGSKYMSPSTGIILNNQMDDFSTPGLINSFGVPPSENNFIKPGKRPVSSMSPSIVVDNDNRVVAIVGASGGTKIITSVAQVIYRLVYMRQSVKASVDARRLHHQLVPMHVSYEEGVTKWIIDGLKARGHKVSKKPIGGSVIQAISVDRNTGMITANADFRKGGTVDGF